jgi:hypothetical protein
MNAAETAPAAPLPTPWRQGSMYIHDTTFSIWEEHANDPTLMQVFRSYCSRLQARGWKVVRDAHADKHYKCLSNGFRCASKGDLLAHLQLSGCRLEIVLYQDKHRVENPNGGRYDFNKYLRMPLPMRTLAVVEIAALATKGRELGYTYDPRLRIDESRVLLEIKRCVMDPWRNRLTPLDRFNESWSTHVGKHQRDARGWPTPDVYSSPHRSCADRDGVPIVCGDTRYFREKGRLYRGVCWPNMNDQWMVYYGGEATVKNSRELFGCERPDLEPRRVVPKQAERLAKELEKASKASNWYRARRIAEVLERMDRAARAAAPVAPIALTEPPRSTP